MGRLPLKIVVPLSDGKERYGTAPWMVHVEATQRNQLNKDSTADCFQVRSISEERFVRKIGEVDEVVMLMIQRALSAVLSIK
jgi:mRNA interferase MazF